MGYISTMNRLLLVFVLLLLFGGSGFYFGGPAIGGGGLGLVLLICLVVFFIVDFSRRPDRKTSRSTRAAKPETTCSPFLSPMKTRTSRLRRQFFHFAGQKNSYQ